MSLDANDLELLRNMFREALQEALQKPKPKAKDTGPKRPRGRPPKYGPICHFKHRYIVMTPEDHAQIAALVESDDPNSVVTSRTFAPPPPDPTVRKITDAEFQALMDEPVPPDEPDDD